ncbi:hypothetical protein AN1V17_11860 [Vallitalea sediminicola]
MESWANEWGKEMKGKSHNSLPIIARVTQISPLELSIYSGNVILYPSNIYITKTIQTYLELNKIIINDKVMVIETEGQKYFAVDKVV